MDGSIGIAGETVNFTALASDVDVEPDWLSVVWRSDKDGDIGISTPTSAGEVSFSYGSLTVNTHTITMVVTDEIEDVAALAYTVGTAPSVTIDSPLHNQTYSEGENIDFIATVSDEQNPPNRFSGIGLLMEPRYRRREQVHLELPNFQIIRCPMDPII